MLLVEGRKEQSLSPNAWRRGRPRHLNAPEGTISRVDLHWRRRLRSNSAAIWAAELRPIRHRCCGRTWNQKEAVERGQRQPLLPTGTLQDNEEQKLQAHHLPNPKTE